MKKQCVVVLACLWLVPALAAQETHSYTPADIEAGARLYQGSCAGCHGPTGDGVAGIDLARGQFRRATSDTDLIKLIQTGIPGTTMPPHNFSDQQAGTVVAYVRNMAATLSPGRPGSSVARGGAADAVRGDASRGATLFQGKGACLTCHRVNGKGSRLGPDLSDVGAIRQMPELQQSLLDPNATIRPGNRSFQATTKSGATITGHLLNQDSFSVQLLDSSERLVSLTKADLRDYGYLKTSPMPSYRDKLNPQEVADLVAYLLTLKGLNP